MEQHLPPHGGLGGAPAPSETFTRRVQLVRRDGRDVSTMYGRELGGGGGKMAACTNPNSKER